MNQWGWEQLHPWVSYRVEIPVGALFCLIDRGSRGRPLSASNARHQLQRTAARAGVRRRFAPQLL